MSFGSCSIPPSGETSFHSEIDEDYSKSSKNKELKTAWKSSCIVLSWATTRRTISISPEINQKYQKTDCIFFIPFNITKYYFRAFCHSQIPRLGIYWLWYFSHSPPFFLFKYAHTFTTFSSCYGNTYAKIRFS